MFNKTQLIEAMSYFTAQITHNTQRTEDIAKVEALSECIYRMTSICSQGKREVAKLVSLITGLDIKPQQVTVEYKPYVVLTTPIAGTYLLTGKSGDTFYNAQGSSVLNRTLLRQAKVASCEDIVIFANKIWNSIESYELTKAFVKMLEAAVKSYLETTKEK